MCTTICPLFFSFFFLFLNPDFLFNLLSQSFLFLSMSSQMPFLVSVMIDRSIPTLPPWEHGQFCSLGLLAMDGCDIIETQACNLQTIQWTLFCCALLEPLYMSFEMTMSFLKKYIVAGKLPIKTFMVFCFIECFVKQSIGE